MDPRRRQSHPLVVTFGEAVLEPYEPQVVPYVESEEPLVIDMPQIPRLEAVEPLQINVEEAGERALENLSRGKR